MEKALSWSSIKPDDTKALQVYTLFLRGCCNAMEDVSYMHELDMPSNMLAIIKKMPYRLRDKWRTVACDLQEKNKQRATFKDMVNFLERQVKIITDPLFGDIKDATSQNVMRSKTQPHSRIKGNIFATTVTVAEKKIGGTKENLPVDRSCLFCGGGHALEKCPQLEKRAHSEKITFLKENGVCFGCLCKGREETHL